MKKLFVYSLLIFVFPSILWSAVIKTERIFEAGNIRASIWNTGVLFQSLAANNTPGFEWPKNSGKHAIFTAGLSTGCFINGNLRLASCSYNGELAPGYVDTSFFNPKFKTSGIFKQYLVKACDNQNNNPDYANWGLMVPYGAPYTDVNNNGRYDANIDKPGVPGADQTIFVCITDADPSNHTTSEGFGGGTLPVYAEQHITMWGYNLPNLENVIFLRYEIVNKSCRVWEKPFFGLFCEPRIGDGSDDYAGCDSTLNLGYGYNADNDDLIYGENPPAAGLKFLKTPLYKGAQLGMTSFTVFSNDFNSCEGFPSSPMGGYMNFRALKKDSTNWLSPLTYTYTSTKYCFSGNPEDSSGWTEYKGKIVNCRNSGAPAFVQSSPGEKRFLMGTGSDSLTIQPFRKFNIVFAALVDKGTSNLNSVTKLKSLANIAQTFYDYNFNFQDEDLTYVAPVVNLPETYKLEQNFPNPFNPSTTIKFILPESINTSLKIYDMNGKEIAVLENKFLSKGEYEYKWDASNVAAGIYFYKLQTDKFSQTKKMVLIK